MSLQTITYVLALSRMFFGGTSLLVPKGVSETCSLPYAPNSTPILLRLFGARDFAIALYLWQTRNCVEPRRAALQVGLLVDVIDIFSNLVSYADGSLALKPAILAGGGAVVLTALGAGALSMLGDSASGIASVAANGMAGMNGKVEL